MDIKTEKDILESILQSWGSDHIEIFEELLISIDPDQIQKISEISANLTELNNNLVELKNDLNKIENEIDSYSVERLEEQEKDLVLKRICQLLGW